MKNSGRWLPEFLNSHTMSETHLPELEPPLVPVPLLPLALGIVPGVLGVGLVLGGGVMSGVPGVDGRPGVEGLPIPVPVPVPVPVPMPVPVPVPVPVDVSLPGAPRLVASTPKCE